MDYKVKLNWQEDENASRGTRYWVEFANDRVLIETNGESWQDAMAKAIDKLQEAGEI
jgi:hypothetical protein